MEKAQENLALVIAASIIAVIRLRGQDIKPSPKLVSTVRDSVNLARLVLAGSGGKGVTARTANRWLRHCAHCGIISNDAAESCS